MPSAPDACPGELPGRGALLDDLCALLKLARRPPGDHRGSHGLDPEGRIRLERLVARLSGHLWFEHRRPDQLRAELLGGIDRYRQARHGPAAPGTSRFARQLLHELAAAPTSWTVHLGVQHLTLPPDLAVGDVRLVHPDRVPDAAAAFRAMFGVVPRLVCVATVAAGTRQLAVARARRRAERALALVRQQVLCGGPARRAPGELAFGLDGRYVVGGDGIEGGWWALVHPVDLDLSAAPEAVAAITGLARQRGGLGDELRQRVDTALEWLDVAAASQSWRTVIPAVFSAMEALLVPESSGRKAGAVTVRSVAVHVAAGHGFFEPHDIVTGYEWRCRLVHGSPTAEVDDAALTDLAEDRRRWAFQVFSDTVGLAASAGIATVEGLVDHLDRRHAPAVCRWLAGHGGADIVAEYHEMLALAAGP